MFAGYSNTTKRIEVFAAFIKQLVVRIQRVGKFLLFVPRIIHYHNHHVPEALGFSLFLNPQDEVGPSNSSLVVICFCVLSV
jgi:hypothetical protein